MLRTLHRPLRHRCRMQSHLPHRCRSRAQCDLTKRSRKYPFLPVPSPHRTHDHPAIPGQPPPRGIKTSDASRSPNVPTLPTSSHCPHPHDPPTSSHRHNNLAMPRRPKGPAHRPASATSSLPPQPSLHPSLPPTHSAGETPGTDRLGGGSWLPLGSQENALEARGHLSEQRKLRVVSPGLRP